MTGIKIELKIKGNLDKIEMEVDVLRI